MTEGFLGTGASFRSDVTLIAYLLLIVPALIAGYIFARRGRYEPHHKLTMTGVVLLNWVLILWVMFPSYRGGVAPQVPSGISQLPVWLPTVHLGIGLVAQLLGTYLVIRMWFEKVLPPALMVHNIKPYMRATLVGWFIAAALGVSTYIVWYGGTSVVDDGAQVVPAATEDVTEDSSIPQATEDAAPQPEATEEVSG